MDYTMMDRLTDLIVLAVCFAPGAVAISTLARRAEREGRAEAARARRLRRG